jgi:hypothetical protein
MLAIVTGLPLVFVVLFRRAYRRERLRSAMGGEETDAGATRAHRR